MKDSGARQTVECFICRAVLSDANRTIEHFVPKWMKRRATERPRFLMSNWTLLENKSAVTWACAPCNSKFGGIEDRIAKALELGPDALGRVKRDEAAAWAAKVLWGFATLDSVLSRDRRDPNSTPIIDQSSMKRLESLRIIAHGWVSGAGNKVGSLHAFRAQHLPGDDFDYMDDPELGLVAFRLGEVAFVICAFDDGRAESLTREDVMALGYLPVWSDLGNLFLGPIQFREVFAWNCTLQASRFVSSVGQVEMGPCDRRAHSDHLIRLLGSFPSYWNSQSIGNATFLFNADMTPRFVSMADTRSWGEAMTRANPPSADWYPK